MVNVRAIYNCIKSNKWKITCLIAIVVTGWLLWYRYLAIWVVYAIDKEKGPVPVYRSMNHDWAMEKYMNMNAHKEEGVKCYILVDEEEGNSLIPF